VASKQALSLLLLLLLQVQLISAVLFFLIYLPKQLCTLQLVPSLPKLARSWHQNKRCLLLLLLQVQLVSAVLYFLIYLPKQLCTLQLVPSLPELADSWCDTLSACMDRCLLLLALLPGATAGIPSGCSSNRSEALLLLLLFSMLLLVLFIPVAFVFSRELGHKVQYLREQQQCRVVCVWDRWGLFQGAPSRLLVLVVVLLVPWQLALAGAAVAMRVLPVDRCT
jgi:uncharacterized membrane protein